MTIALFWVLLQMNAPWWCFGVTIIMFLMQCLMFFWVFGGKYERID